MANYGSGGTRVKVFYGDITATEHSGSVGSLSKEVYDYILTLDSTNQPLISINTTALGYGNKVAITVVNAK